MHKFRFIPQELDEATAITLAVQLHNQIEALKSWERKLRLPFMPTTRLHMQVVPEYAPPTAATVLHIVNDQKRFAVDVSRTLVHFMEGRRDGQDRD